MLLLHFCFFLHLILKNSRFYVIPIDYLKQSWYVVLETNPLGCHKRQAYITQEGDHTLSLGSAHSHLRVFVQF